MESILQEQERLASLGTLAAGLAHELNNPAAAARSSADLLGAAVDGWDRACAALGALAAGGGPAATPLAGELLDSLREELASRAADPPVIDPLDAADHRDAVCRLLRDLGMTEPDEPAAALVGLGWDGNQVDDLLAPFESDEARLVVATWLAAAALVRQLLVEVGMAARRISEIVGAVREYTFLDQAPLQRVKVTSGIENTLVILRARWKAGVEVRREYAADLPAIEAYGSELNQVWTNLVGNAIDAMGARGSLRIAAWPDPAGDGVVVEICDSGPGVPPDVRDRIFEPFFTTKEVGAGTGLGLHISRSIVVRHGGRLELGSTGPEGTCFRTTLPARVPAVPADSPDPDGPAVPGAGPAAASEVRRPIATR
jgi:signal transduction histidine kinase